MDATPEYLARTRTPFAQVAYLIVDPHYTGQDDLKPILQSLGAFGAAGRSTGPQLPTVLESSLLVLGSGTWQKAATQHHNMDLRHGDGFLFVRVNQPALAVFLATLNWWLLWRFHRI